MFEFCIPTKATVVPDGSDWLHEIKYDGYRLRLERDGKGVRLMTRAAATSPTAIHGLWRRRGENRAAEKNLGGGCAYWVFADEGDSSRR
jgi:hypothetical protein